MSTLHNHRRTLAGAIALVSLVSATSPLLAADRTWSGAASNTYSNTANWTGNVPAGAGDRAVFANISATRSLVNFESAVTVQDVLVSGTTPAGNWTLNAVGTGNGLTTGSFNLNNTFGSTVATLGASMSLSASTVDVGAASTLNVSGATVNDSSTATIENGGTLNLGAGNTSGTLNFNNGATFVAGSTFNYASGTLFVAPGKSMNVNGTVNVTAGGRQLSTGSTLSIGANGSYTTSSYLDLANGTGSLSGILVVSGDNSVFTTNTTYSDLGKNAGNIAVATVSTGGTANYNAGLDMAANGGTATINVNGGGVFNVASRFNAGTAVVGSTANLNVAGGTFNMNTDGAFLAGSKLNWSAGSFVIGSGKTVTFNRGTANLTIGGTAQSDGSTITLNNAGVFKTANYFDLHTGSLNIDGLNSSMDVSGTAVTDWAAITGDVANVSISNSGTAFYRAGLRIGIGGTATVNLTSTGLLRTVNTPLIIGGNATSNAVINVNGGILSTTGAGANVTMGQGATVNLINNAVIFDGTLTMSGNAKILASATQSTTIASRDLSIASTSKIDVGLGSLVVSYNTPAQIDVIRGLLFNGRNGGNWAGNGITSSYVAAHPKLSLTYMDDGNSVSVGITVAGDADYSGTTTFPDLVLLAQHYNLPNRHWQDGDFNFDGTVNFSDLVILAQNYGQSAMLTSGQLTTLQSAGGADFANEWALAQSMVPEPTTLASVLAGVTLMARRRRA